MVGVKKLKGCKNLYEAWKQQKLPVDLQSHLDAVFDTVESWDEGLFKAGFILGLRYKEYQKHLESEE